MNLLRSFSSFDSKLSLLRDCAARFVPVLSPGDFTTRSHGLSIARYESVSAADPTFSIGLQSVSKSSSTELKVKKISRAMKAYLERAQKYEDFMKEKIEEFEIGKQHLANMMGLDADRMTQEDIDKAIRYLMPSGLYQPKARPMMKHPLELFPKEKAAQFDESGRPFSPFFYTNRSNFYEAVHDLVAKFHELDAFEDKMIQKGILEPPPETKVILEGGNWLVIDDLKKIFVEEINEFEYEFFITTLTRLAEHPYAFRCKDHIWIYRKDFEDLSAIEDIPAIMYDENKRPYMTSPGQKKHAKANVTVYGDGTGKVKINDMDISYFHTIQEREKIMFPIHLAGMLEQVDVEATVAGSGVSAQAAAIRYGIAMSLRSFVTPEVHERMRLAGLLTADRRKGERKKPGQRGARAKFTWKKR